MSGSSIHSLKIRMTSHRCNKYEHTMLSYLLSDDQNFHIFKGKSFDFMDTYTSISSKDQHLPGNAWVLHLLSARVLGFVSSKLPVGCAGVGAIT